MENSKIESNLKITCGMALCSCDNNQSIMTMTSHGHHRVSLHRQIDSLFNSYSYWQQNHQSFMLLAQCRGIRRCLVDSLTKSQYFGKHFHVMKSSWFGVSIRKSFKIETLDTLEFMLKTYRGHIIFNFVVFYCSVRVGVCTCIWCDSD